MDRQAYKTNSRNEVFIPTADFDYIINEFKSVSPLLHPVHAGIESGFDSVGINCFDKETIKQIIDNIEKSNYNDKKVEKFTEEVIAWLKDTLEYADLIVVYGNL